MLGVVIQIDGYDPVAAAPVTLRLASHDDARVCHLNATTWWPVLAALPKLPYDLFDGNFAGNIAAPASSLSFAAEPWLNLARYMLADARLRLWTGEVGAAWGDWVQRVEARVSAQPAIADGRVDLDFAVDDRWLDAPLLATYAGTGGAEGGASLKGQVKPLAIGAPRYVAGTLIDPINSIFQLSAYGAIEGVDQALERLARFGGSAGDWPSHAALVAAAIQPGRWATARAEGMVRFGAPPAGQVSFLVRGDNSLGWVRLPGSVIQRLAILSGGTGKIDTASLAALDLSRPFPISLNLTAQTTARALIQAIAASLNCVAGVSWLGKLFVAPVAIGAPALTLAADGSALPPVASVEQVAIGAPWWRLAIGAERTETVHPLSDVAFYAQLVDLGAYASGTTYREGNIVQDQGSTWLYINPTPTSGNPPPLLPATANAYWKVLAKAGATGPAGPGGAAGAPGATGADGATLYSWIAYADAPDGTVNFATGAPGARAYQGIAVNKASPTESINPADYTWAPYRGPALFGLVARGNCVVGPNFALKNDGASSWDSDVYSDVSFIGGCVMNASPAQANAHLMCGINTDPVTNQSYDTIDRAFHLGGDGEAAIWEDNAYVADAGSYVAGDVFQIRYDNRSVTYLKNGVVQRVKPEAAGYAFYLDSSFFSPGGRLNAISWTAAGSAGADGADGAPGAPGAPGTPGRDAIVLHQDDEPVGPVDGDTWITRTGVPKRFYKREGGVWVQLLGDVAGLSLIDRAYIADAAIGSAQIDDLSVNTLHLGGEAVTLEKISRGTAAEASLYARADLNDNDQTTFTALMGIQVTANDGAPMRGNFGFIAQRIAGSGRCWIRVIRVNDGTEVWCGDPGGIEFTLGAANTCFFHSFLDTVDAGVTTSYDVQIKVESGTIIRERVRRIDVDELVRHHFDQIYIAFASGVGPGAGAVGGGNINGDTGGDGDTGGTTATGSNAGYTGGGLRRVTQQLA